MKKCTVFAVLLVFLLKFNAEASMVSFYIVETGLPENGRLNEHSILWENAFMDVFFDGGFIVSNAPILRLDSLADDDLLHSVAVDLSEARRWGAEYVLITILDFAFQSTIPSEITFFIYNVNTNEKIFDKQIQGRNSRNSREDYEYIKTVVRGLIPYIG